MSEFWQGLRGSPTDVSQVEFTGSHQGLPSKYPVSPIASAAVATATLAVAEIAKRRGMVDEKASITFDRSHAAASYLCDQLAKPQGWSFDTDPDDISGNYQTEDGWLRIHAMYRNHRKAAITALGCGTSRTEVSNAILARKKTELEAAIIGLGGCAAELRSPLEWKSHPQGIAVAKEKLFSFHGKTNFNRRFFGDHPSTRLPLAGLRVLDLTRVLAGPIGARFLAAYGADVIRVDPIDFFESNALLIETTRGKRTVGLNLKNPADSKKFATLLRTCDVLIHGYRPGAMENLGFSSENLTAINPGLVIVRHNAYGWTGPWSDRRGFDSLVQMSCGIAFASEHGKPQPLPAQALDYTTGYLIAAAACRGLLEKHQESRLSLARTAHALARYSESGEIETLPFQNLEPFMFREASEWGDVIQLKCPGRIGDFEPRWTIPAGRICSLNDIAWQS